MKVKSFLQWKVLALAVVLSLVSQIHSNEEVNTDSGQEVNGKKEVEAVNITLGDYFKNRSDPHIYAVGFAVNDRSLQEHLAVRVKYVYTQQELDSMSEIEAGKKKFL